MIPESLVVETAADRIATAAKMRRFGYDATPEQMAESVVAAVVREQDIFGPDEAFRWIEDHKKEMVKMLAAGIALAEGRKQTAP